MVRACGLCPTGGDAVYNNGAAPARRLPRPLAPGQRHGGTAVAGGTLEVKTSLASAITVRAGDTASKLVLQKMPAGVSLDQMLLAMVRANPEAFIEGNVNLLREGAQIRLPSADEAAQVSAEDARKNVIAQTANFVAYARRLAQSALKATDTPSREMTGKVSAELPAPEQAAPSQDKLTLSKRDGSTDGTEAKLAIEREAQDKTEQLTALKKDLEALESLSATTTAAKPEDKSSSNPSATQAALPPVAQQAKGLSLLETMGRTLPIWAWLGALFAAMAGLVWWVRRRRTLIGQDLFASRVKIIVGCASAQWKAVTPSEFIARVPRIGGKQFVPIARP